MKTTITRLLFYLALLTALSNCKTSPKDANEIIDRSIEVHGGDNFRHCTISFDFRGRHYISNRNYGQFTYHRQFADSTGNYDDILSNDGFRRLKNGQEVNLSSERSQAFTNSVNSVIYFALLPFFLNDPAVSKDIIGEKTINGQHYYKIMVTFNPQSGGVDYEDQYVYWINKETFTLDYLAYLYHVDGGGLRFRKANNPRTIQGIRFQDYTNYEYGNLTTPVEQMDELWEKDQLKKLSEINLENIQVVIH